MPILTRATENSQSEWRPVFEGLWRWMLSKPELKEDQQYGGYRVHFGLQLPQPEQKRIIEENGDPEPGTQQSWRTTYRPSLKLGYFKDNQYQTTKLVDFLCAALGTESGKRFRKWIEAGNGPPRPADKDDQKAELECIEEWLGWWEGLELYGTITHSTDKTGRVWANFGGPMPIGSLPGQPEPEYQALCRGKLRAMIAETDTAAELLNKPAAQVAVEREAKSDRYEEIFGEEEDKKPPKTAAPAVLPVDDDEPF